MEANSIRASTNSETSSTMTDERRTRNEVVVVISAEESDATKCSHPDSSSASKDSKSKETAAGGGVDTPSLQSVSTDSHTVVANSTPLSCPSPEIAHFSPSPNKPPKIPPSPTSTLTRRKSLPRSVSSKPKSRFGEPSVPLDSTLFEEITSSMEEQVVDQASNSPLRNIFHRASPNHNKITPTTTTTLMETISTGFINSKTPLMASPGAVRAEDEDEEIYRKVSIRNKLKYKRVKMMVLIEWVAFACILGCLVASLTIDELQHSKVWSLEIWKWCVLVMVTFCGMLVTHWFIHFIVLLIELNFLLRKKVLYFVHGLKKSVQVCVWLTLVLVTWALLFNNRGVKRSETASRIFYSITWSIVSLLIGAFLWVLKTLLLKILASSFHVNTFFDRIQESIFYQYILQTLSGPALMASAEMLGRTNSVGQLSFRRTKKAKEGKEKEVIDITKLQKTKQEKVSAWTMKMLVDVISNSGLSTISNTLDETDYDGGEQTDKEITNEMEAIAAAFDIFRKVAQPGCKYIDELDLRRFMIKEEVDHVFPLIDVAETGRIDKKALTEWVVKVYKGRKALAHALTDTKTAVKQLNKLVTGILIIVMIVVWLLLMEIATTKVIVFLSSQLVVAAFMFGNTCKTIFEAVIFVFVMHPFDVGDRCVIDGVQMIVEEMNILNTVFLKFDNEKIYYPNSVLATKPISNFYRSPEMGDSLEFSIDFMTPLATIGTLKDKIKKYLENNPHYWHDNHNVVVKEIENVNKIKMVLFFNHTMNFQDFGEKNRRRSELVLEMKKIFEELNIKYNLLPQEVHLVQSAAITTGTSK